MISRPFTLPSLSRKEAMFFASISVLLPKIPYVLSISQRNRFKFPFSTRSMEAAQQSDTKYGCISGILRQETSPMSGVEDALMGFISGKRKATELAHAVWQNVVQKGDTVVDATCGNGHDTLALLEMVADESGKGCVYGMDIQDSALENSSSLLEMSVSSNKRKLVKLFSLCHSKMEDVVKKGSLVRLVAFNLGYLPGGDKSIITTSEITLLALQAASRVLGSGGLISAMVYVGHPGGRDELETVQTFSSGLSVEKWVCYKFESLNRPTSPVLVLLFKK